MRLIDADRAMEIVRDQRIAHPNAYHLTNYATLILQEAPTVDAAEVLRGMWISVEERFPEEDGKYLVFEQNNGRTNTSILRFAKDARKVDRYDFKSRWENAWYEYDSEWGHYTVDSVTHWMPLPEMPQK